VAGDHRAAGAFLFAYGLDFADHLADAGVAPDFVDVVDSYSLYFERRYRYLPLSSPLRKANALLQAMRQRLTERAASRRNWTLLAAGTADMERFAGGNARAVALPNSTAWAAMPPLYVRRQIAARIGFHGTMMWDPNVSAAEYIARKIMPRVLLQMPIARFSLFGGPLVPRIEALRDLPRSGDKGACR
jgi:hypothetical protein